MIKSLCESEKCVLSCCKLVHVDLRNFLGGEKVERNSEPDAPPSHERAVRPEYVRVALPVHVLAVALDAVAAVDLCERRRHEGGRAEEAGVGERAGELHPLLVPVSPQDTLDLQEETSLGKPATQQLQACPLEP